MRDYEREMFDKNRRNIQEQYLEDVGAGLREWLPLPPPRPGEWFRAVIGEGVASYVAARNGAYLEAMDRARKSRLQLLAVGNARLDAFEQVLKQRFGNG